MAKNPQQYSQFILTVSNSRLMIKSISKQPNVDKPQPNRILLNNKVLNAKYQSLKGKSKKPTCR